MKKAMIVVLFVGLVSGLAGCEKSAQEKVAEEQLKAIELSKKIQEQIHKDLAGMKNAPPEEWAYTKKLRTDAEKK